jgi:hypothetical protein
MRIEHYQPALLGSSIVKTPCHIPVVAMFSNWLINRVFAPSVPLVDRLQVFLQIRSITAFKFAQSDTPCASPSSLNYGLQVHLWVHSLLASTCTSILTRSQCPITSPSSLRLSLHLNLLICSITTSNCIPEHVWSRPPSAAVSLLDHHIPVHHEVFSTDCSQSRSTVCRFDTYIHTRVHWYIDENTRWMHKFQKPLNKK